MASHSLNQDGDRSRSLSSEPKSPSLPDYGGKGILSTISIAPDARLIGETRSEAIQKALGLTIRPASGTYLYTPLGNRLLRQIENVIYSEFEGVGALKVSFPVLCPPQLPSASNSKSRLETFAKGIFHTTGDHRDFILNPSSEEMATWAIQYLGPLSYREVPKIIYDLGKRFRVNEGAKGFNRAHEYSLCEAYGFCSNVEEERGLKKLLCSAIEGILSHFQFSYRTAETVSTEGNRVVNFYILAPEIDRSTAGPFRITAKSSADELLLLDSNSEIAGVAGKRSASSVDTNLSPVKAFRVAQVTEAGSRYSEHLDIQFQTASQSHEYLRCVTAGLSINKLMSALLEANFTPAGMNWPKSVVPFEVAIVPLGEDSTSPAWNLSKQVWETVRTLSNNIVFDDREKTARSKIVDHRLLGIPLRIFSGARAVETGTLEFSYSDRPSSEIVPVADLSSAIKKVFPD